MITNVSDKDMIEKNIASKFFLKFVAILFQCDPIRTKKARDSFSPVHFD